MTPLDEHDRRVLQYRPLARKVARRLASRYPFCPIDDLEAAALLGISKGLSRDRGGVSQRQFLFVCARNEAVREGNSMPWAGLRGMSREDRGRAVRVDKFPWEELPDRKQPAPAAEECNRVLGCLQPSLRELLRMRFIEGMEYEEIARRKHYESAHLARGMVAHAMKRLRDNLAS